MRWVYYAISILILYILQTIFPSGLMLFGAKPILLLGFVVSVALMRGGVDGGVVGLICGLLMDLLSGRIIGVNAFLFMYAGAITGFLCAGFFKEKSVVALVFAAASTMLYGMIYGFLSFTIWGESGFVALFWNIILPETIFTAIMAVPIFIANRYFNKRYIK